MKVLEEKKLKGLKKEFLIEIPFSELSQASKEKLESISTKVKIAGYRPCKLPLSHIEKLNYQITFI